MSILVPSHVRSPRRVKNLLNAFVLTYRLAEARQKAGQLHGDMTPRTDEIARMVCLRIEFPLFARDLVLDARLPEYVLRLHKGEPEKDVWKDHPHATAQVRALAQGFADRELPVAMLLSRPAEGDGDEDDPDSQDGPDDAGNGQGAEDAGRQDVGRQHGRQLLDYLSRTRSVSGPGRDLLFLQRSGSAVGLDGQVAEQLEQDAANGSLDSLLAVVRALDAAGQDAAVSLLIGQSLGAVGLEAQNVALSLLAVAALPDVDVPARADALADALADPVNDAPSLVEDGGLQGAWRLALHSERPTALRLRGIVLAYAAGHDDDLDIATTVLRDSDAALDADADTCAALLATHLLRPDGDSAPATAQVLLDMPAGQAARLLTASNDTIGARLRKLLAPEDPPAPDSTVTPPGRAAAPPAPPAAPVAPPADEQPLPDSLAAVLGQLLDELDGSPQGPAHALTGALLQANRFAARQLIGSRLASMSPSPTAPSPSSSSAPAPSGT